MHVTSIQKWSKAAAHIQSELLFESSQKEGSLIKAWTQK
jgi:hypothetical protein